MCSECFVITVSTEQIGVVNCTLDLHAGLRHIPAAASTASRQYSRKPSLRLPTDYFIYHNFSGCDRG